MEIDQLTDHLLGIIIRAAKGEPNPLVEPEDDRDGYEMEYDEDEDEIELQVNFEVPARAVLRKAVETIMIDAARHGLVEPAPDMVVELQRLYKTEE